MRMKKFIAILSVVSMMAVAATAVSYTHLSGCGDRQKSYQICDI